MITNFIKSLDKLFKKTDIIVEILVMASIAFYIIGISFNYSTAMSFPIAARIARLLIRSSFALVIFTTMYTILTMQFDIKVTAILIIIGFLLAINYYYARDGRLMLVYCYSISSKNIKPEKIMNVALISISFILIFVISLRILNIIPDITEYMTRTDGSVRNGLGFYVANVASYHFITITLLYIFVRKEKITIVEMIVMYIINLAIFNLTKTRNSFLATNIAITLTILVKYIKSDRFYEIFGIISTASYILGAASIFLLTLFYGTGNELALKLNQLLTGRLKLAWDGLNTTFGITLFGQNISTHTGSYSVIDSSYINCLVVYGIIFFILMLIFFTTFVHFAVKAGDKYLVIVLFVLFYYSIFDGAWLMFGYDPFTAVYISIMCTAYPSLKDKFYTREIYSF